LSTSANLAERAPEWKQEVNRRLAAHQSRKGLSAVPETPVEIQRVAGGRAAEAAARVAARYAKAPSYSDLLAGEARAAVRAAEAVSKAAQRAQAAAESVLAGLEAASYAEPGVESSAPSLSQAVEKPSYAIRWEADMPVRQEEPAYLSPTERQGNFKIPVEHWREPGEPARDGEDAPGDVEEIEMVEAAQPIHANLIEFPRELVAARKARPRRAERPQDEAGEPEKQLSIFEVDPGPIQAQPAVAAAWSGPEWLGIKLDEEPQQESETEAGSADQDEIAATVTAAEALRLAPINRRLLAAVVDGSLIAGAFLAGAMTAATHVKELPGLHLMELGAAGALVVIGVLYQVLFFTLAESTPGMKYARISLCTLDGRKPTGAQRRGRLGALLLSLLPVGLGVAWAIFDEQHLSWHDRLSRTYVRRV
jgi:uncharacterized RDD family membrane protein YckC